MKVRVSSTSTHKDHFTILMILTLFDDRSFKSHTNSTILRSLMHHCDFSLDIVTLASSRSTRTTSSHWMCSRTKKRILEATSRSSYRERDSFISMSFRNDLHRVFKWFFKIFVIILTNCVIELIASWDKRVNFNKFSDVWNAMIFRFRNVKSSWS